MVTRNMAIGLHQPLFLMAAMNLNRLYPQGSKTVLQHRQQSLFDTVVNYNCQGVLHILRKEPAVLPIAVSRDLPLVDHDVSCGQVPVSENKLGGSFGAHFGQQEFSQGSGQE